MNEAHYVMDVLLMFGKRYNLRMREGARGGSRDMEEALAYGWRGRFIILAARETNSIEYEPEFCFDISCQGYIR